MSDDIAAALEAPLTALALVPVEATVTTAGTRRVLRVLVDRDVSRLDPTDASSPVAPLTLDEVAEATRVVGDSLDALDLMGERPYTLEVSSPGVGRPLTGYAALRRNVGRLVTLTVEDGSFGHRPGPGRHAGRGHGGDSRGPQATGPAPGRAGGARALGRGAGRVQPPGRPRGR